MEEKSRQSGRWTAVTIIIAVMLVLYPLSAGPAEWLKEAGYLPEWAVSGFYTPLGFVINLLPLKVQLLWLKYIELFVEIRFAP